MPSVLDRFQALWNSSDAPPDVFAYLKQHSEADPESQLAVLRFDQVQRWQTAHPLKVEDYLNRLPELAQDSDCRLELVLGEFQARQIGSNSPSLQEFLARFPDLNDTLRGKLSGSDTRQNPGANTHGLAATQSFDSTQMDQRIGRYRLLRVLGEGAFGRVLLAWDEELRRQVAIKVPQLERFQSPADAEAYLAEARTLASLDHPNIVPVYDVGRTEDGSIYVVSKFIEGTDLKERIEHNRPGIEEAAQLIAVVAQALQHAHQKRLIHRDIKPANILIEEATNTPYVADFGLAIKEEDFLHSMSLAGTPAYMSPEQARGEGHRLDGRSDIFSLGIVLYELLTGKRPFRGSSAQELMVQISTTEPRSPRELAERVPVELERICLKSLAKKASDRYATAADLADDLLHWNQSPLQEQRNLQIVPKGLRSFDAEDADFFLDLLPGPRNRDGLPESIAFWKTRMEETDADQTFAVGLIYGPSGCGKSSLVKAGLLPRLSSSVVAVCIEATPEDAETRILRGLRKRLPDLPEVLGLVETLTHLRRETGHKVIVILDQFEQWLHVHGTEPETDLVNALRQCDGGNLQAVVMVRDDFAMAAARFMDLLDIPILQGHNFATVDLFEVEHAEKVLMKFGQAFGKLPAQADKLSEDETAFVSAVANGLARDGQVVSVRLTLFAEMVKGKPWVLKTLEEVGGTEGIGVNFLEDTFAARTANPKHRQHQQAARDVLKCLLPRVGSDIKGHMRSQAELLDASGYQNRPKEFAELIRIVDGELRLITPTDPAGFQSETETHPEAKYYQLTHDYLVPSLREWLTRKQRETKQGRAELRLAERSALWNAKPENRHLPSWWEWANIRRRTEKKKWTQPERQMMKRAGRFHSLRTLLLLLLVMGVSFAGVSVRRSLIESNRSTRARELVESLQKAEVKQVPDIVRDLAQLREWADPILKTRIEAAADGTPEKLRFSLALLPVDASQGTYLFQQLPGCSLKQFPVVRDALLPYQEQFAEELWELVQQETHDPAQRFQAAAALAMYSPEDDLWLEIAPFVAQFLTSSASSVDFGDWLDHFQPTSQHITNILAAIHADRSKPARHRETAALALARYWGDQPEKLVDALLVADEPAEFLAFVASLKPQAQEVKQRLQHEMNNKLPAELDKTNHLLPDDQEKIRDDHWKRQSLAAVALVHLGFMEDAWPLLKFSPNPSLRSFLIHHLGKLGSNHNTLAARLELEQEVSIRRALIQSLGGLDSNQIPASDRERIAEHLKNLYVNDPDSGIHSSTSWTLRQWGITLPELSVGEPTLSEEQKQRLTELTQKLSSLKRQIASYEKEELPKRQQAWEQSLREQPTAEPPTLKEGLVAHYPLDETEGFVVHNAVEGQPSGAFPQSQPLRVPGVLGTAIEFDGKGGHFTCGDAFSFERTDPMTLACWFKTSVGKKRYYFLSTIADDRGCGISLDLTTNTIMCEWIHQYPANWTSAEGAIPEVLGEWHHLAATYDGSSKANGFAIYLDGQPVPLKIAADSLTESVATSTQFLIGRRIDGWFYTGLLDEWRLYNRSLTAEEVRQLHKETLRRIQNLPQEKQTDDQKALLARWERSAGERLKDSAVDTLKNGLLAYYAFEDVNGTQALNTVNNDLLATYRPTIPPQRVPGVVGSAIQLDGVSSHVDGGDGFNPERTDAFSYGCWFINESPPNRDSALIAKTDRALNMRGFDLFCKTGDRIAAHLIYDEYNGNKRIKVTSTETFDFSRWTHAMMTYDGSSTAKGITLYINGRPVETIIDADNLSGTIKNDLPLNIGKRDASHAFRGKIDEIRIYGRVVSNSEVKQLYEAGVRRIADFEFKNRELAQQALLSQHYVLIDEGIRRLKNEVVETEAERDSISANNRRWYVNSQGQTMIVVPTPSQMGKREINHNLSISSHEVPGLSSWAHSRRHIDYSFSIATHEVTLAEFRKFKPNSPFDLNPTLDDACPVNAVTWYEATKYCNWLSEQEGISEDQWVYVPNSAGEYGDGMTIKEDFLKLSGYRLPTYVESVHSCRAGTLSSFYFGESEYILPRFAWFGGNSLGYPHPVENLLPNDVGLFDVHGNLLEWNQDSRESAISPIHSRIGRLTHGGSFLFRGWDVRSVQNHEYTPNYIYDRIGFRPCRTWDERAFHASRLRNEAKALLEKGEIASSLAKQEVAAALTGQSLDHAIVRELYARTHQWDQAVESSLKSFGTGDWKTLMMLYEAGRHEEFLAGRKALLANYQQFTRDYQFFHSARIAVLLPIEPELQDAVRAIALHESAPEVKQEWRQVFVGRLMYRLGEFPQWYAALPADSPLRTGQEILVAICDYQRDPSDQHRHALQSIVDQMESDLRDEASRGPLSQYWDVYVGTLALLREAKKALGNPNAEQYGRHTRQWLELNQQAEAALTEKDWNQALKLYVQAANLPGESVDHARVRDVYARTLQWDKAAEISLQAFGRQDWLTLMLLYEAGRHGEFLAGRKALLSNYKNFHRKDEFYNSVRIASLLPLETELREASRAIAEHESAPEIKEAWRKEFLGWLMYRLGEFPEWYAALPKNSPARAGQELLVAICDFQQDPSAQHRKVLQSTVDQLEMELQKEEMQGSLDQRWDIHIRKRAILREAKKVLSDQS